MEKQELYISNISCVTSYGMAVENSVWALTEEQLASVGTAKLERAEVDKSKHEMYAFRLKRPRSTLQVEFWLAYCPVTVRNLRRNRLTDLILLTLVLLRREKREPTLPNKVQCRVVFAVVFASHAHNRLSVSNHAAFLDIFVINASERVRLWKHRRIWSGTGRIH